MSGKTWTWTRENWDKTRALVADGKDLHEVADLVGLTYDQVRRKVHYENLSPAKREIIRVRTNARRQADAEGRPRRERIVPSHKIFEKAPASILAEQRARQATMHRDLTAAFFGDPLPGYSALDQREQRV